MANSDNITPRIYVASLSDYNAGRLVGAWLDIDADTTADDLHEGIKAMLATSKEPIAEEWAIHDHEGFDPWYPSESEDMDTVAKVGAGIDEHGEAFAAYVDNVGADQATVEGFEDAYQGEFDSLEAWAEQWLEDTGGLAEVPDSLRNYIDFAAWGRDAELSGDIYTLRINGQVAVFYNN